MNMKPSDRNLLLASAALAALVLARRRAGIGSIGRLHTLNPLYLQYPCTNLRTALDYLLGGKPGSINNELWTDGTGEVYLSEELQQATGLPDTMTTKKDITAALRALKQGDRLLLWLRTYGDEATHPATRRKVMDDVREHYIDRIERQGARTDRDGYIYALHYIATGGKYAWADRAGHRGLKNELIASRSDARADRKVYAAILNDRRGAFPEQQAEAITVPGDDDQAVKRGIVEAAASVQSPRQAYDTLRDLLAADNDPFYTATPDYSDTPF